MVYVKMVRELANIKFCKKLGQIDPKCNSKQHRSTQSEGQTQNG